MGSFYANGREQGPNRRRNTRPSKRRGFLRVGKPRGTAIAQHGLDADLDGSCRHAARPHGEPGVADHQRIPGLTTTGPRTRPRWRPSSPYSSSRGARSSWASPTRWGPTSPLTRSRSRTWACRSPTRRPLTAWSTAGCRSASCRRSAQLAQTRADRPNFKAVLTPGNRDQRGETLDLRRRRQLGTGARRVPACRSAC